MPLHCPPNGLCCPPMKSIQIYYRNVYGILRAYPADVKQAAALSSLTGGKTLETKHFQALSFLGFTFETVPDPAVASRATYGVTLLPSVSQPSV